MEASEAGFFFSFLSFFFEDRVSNTQFKIEYFAHNWTYKKARKNLLPNVLPKYSF